VDVHTLEQMPSFVTDDGSAIRELAGPQPTSGASVHQSLAEATLAPGAETAEHYHPRAEEIYWFVRGEARMRLGADEAQVRAGDCVVIAPGTPHKLYNTGPEPLVLMCCCAPAYAPDDTVLTGG
jgi:mannose-6-phosphate isomerase-like protein (cupin superfamily)